jgi:iron complex transport system ATP-binding protein
VTPLKCEGLSVGYGKKRVLEGVTFELNPGEIVALLGPNGGGKTTLLKTLAGLSPMMGGTIAVQGKDLKQMTATELARQIGFVPQDEAWQFEFSVEEVVSMGRLPISNGFFDTDEDRQAATEAMKQAGCLDLRDKAGTELSGGERQRVLIARALAQETPILFLDEPTSHLDPQFQVGVTALLRSLAKTGKSLLVAVHDLTIAGILADRGVLVYKGTASPAKEIRALLESQEIDQAYGTEFERVVAANGRLVTIPRERG